MPPIHDLSHRSEEWPDIIPLPFDAVAISVPQGNTLLFRDTEQGLRLLTQFLKGEESYTALEMVVWALQGKVEAQKQIDQMIGVAPHEIEKARKSLNKKAGVTKAAQLAHMAGERRLDKLLPFLLGEIDQEKA